VGLLTPWAHWWAIRLATVFALGFIGYLALAWRIAPDKPCSCMGGRPTKISRRSLARAATVLALTLIGWQAQTFWGAALLAAPWTALIVAAEAFALWLLSPEFNWSGARVEKRVLRALRLRLDPMCQGGALDWELLERRVRGSALFQELLDTLPHLGGRTDHWRDGCVGYLAYEARYHDRLATAVVAFPVWFDPSEISAAVVDAAQDEVLLQLAHTRGAPSSAETSHAMRPTR
jgi:hypothetical protein